MAPLNYATQYSQALDQEFPYSLNFGALYATPNNGRYRWKGADAIEIPSISVTGRVNSDRDTIETAKRNYNNTWQLKQLKNARKWSTLIHPNDIDETNFVTTIANITRVYNESQKFPEMDAYCISKIYDDWIHEGMQPSTDSITKDNVFELFNKQMLDMSNYLKAL